MNMWFLSEDVANINSIAMNTVTHVLWCTWAQFPLRYIHKSSIAESNRMHIMPTVSKAEQPGVTIPVAPHL